MSAKSKRANEKVRRNAEMQARYLAGESVAELADAFGLSRRRTYRIVMANRPRGVRCPVCGDTESTVIDTRPSPGGYTRRRRECPIGHRYTTEEFVREDTAEAELSVAVRVRMANDVGKRLDEMMANGCQD